MTNGLAGGCLRWKIREAFSASVGYDVCICVHAEQNAVITAAWFGNAIEGATVYTTLRPCFDCTMALLQAKIESIYYLHDWQHPEDDLREQYELAQSQFPGGVVQVNMPDPEAAWANGNAAPRA